MLPASVTEALKISVQRAPASWAKIVSTVPELYHLADLKLSPVAQKNVTQTHVFVIVIAFLSVFLYAKERLAINNDYITQSYSEPYGTPNTSDDVYVTAFHAALSYAYDFGVIDAGAHDFLLDSFYETLASVECNLIEFEPVLNSTAISEVGYSTYIIKTLY